MKLTRRIVLCIAAVAMLTMTTAEVQAQETRTAGLTASLQGGQMTILVPIWAGDMMSIAPGVGLQHTDNTGTIIDLVLAPRFYIRMDRVAPYFGGRLGATITMPDGPADNTYDWNGGAVFGGEYFVNPMFSFGVEAQINIRIFDSAAADYRINTGAAAHANVYF